MEKTFRHIKYGQTSGIDNAIHDKQILTSPYAPPDFFGFFGFFGAFVDFGFLGTFVDFGGARFGGSVFSDRGFLV